MSQSVTERIIEHVERVSDSQQRQVLDFARRLAGPSGVRGRDLLHFAGSIDPADLEAMSKAIQEGCEKVDENAR